MSSRSSDGVYPDESSDGVYPDEKLERQQYGDDDSFLENDVYDSPFNSASFTPWQSQDNSDVDDVFYMSSLENESSVHVNASKNLIRRFHHSSPSTPRLNNKSQEILIRTQNNFDVHIPAIRSTTENETYIKLDPLMQGLLGVEFLPILHTVDELSVSVYEEDIDELQEEDIDELQEEDEFLSEDEDEVIDLGVGITKEYHHRNRHHRRKNKKIPHGISFFRNRKSRNNARDKLSQDYDDPLHTKARHIDANLIKIGAGKKGILNVKDGIKSTQLVTKKLMTEIEKSSNRLAKLAKTIDDLESKLELTHKKLLREKVLMQSNLAAVSSLNCQRESLEEAAANIENDDVFNGLPANRCKSGSSGKFSIRKDRSYSDNHLRKNNDLRLQRADTDSNIMMRKRADTDSNSVTRQRTNTDSSFITAHELYTPLKLRDLSFESSISVSSHSYRRSESKSLPPHITKRVDSKEDICKNPGLMDENIQTAKKYSSFLRVHDLDMKSLKMEGYTSTDDLYSLDHDGCLTVLDALANLSIQHATNETSWTPDRKTEKIISNRDKSEQEWHYAAGTDILVWHGKLDHGGYKSNLPVIKARGIIPSSSKDLLLLLLDSSKVKCYNKMSLGRVDQKRLNTAGNQYVRAKPTVEAKIVRSLSSFPLIKKKIELISVMYTKILDEKETGMKGFLLVTRSVWEDEDKVPCEGKYASKDDKDYIRSEMLLGINFIRQIDDDDTNCELTNVTQFFTPGIPTFSIWSTANSHEGSFEFHSRY